METAGKWRQASVINKMLPWCKMCACAGPSTQGGCEAHRQLSDMCRNRLRKTLPCSDCQLDLQSPDDDNVLRCDLCKGMRLLVATNADGVRPYCHVCDKPMCPVGSTNECEPGFACLAVKGLKADGSSRPDSVLVRGCSHIVCHDCAHERLFEVHPFLCGTCESPICTLCVSESTTCTRCRALICARCKLSHSCECDACRDTYA